jgi:hypothetical protein
MKPENIDSRLVDIVDAWKGARGRLGGITDEQARKAAEKVADELFHDSVRTALSPLFKAAVKGKKNGKSHKADKPDKSEKSGKKDKADKSAQ